MSNLQSGSLPSPPPGFTPIAVIRPSLHVLLIGTILPAMLVPILIILFVFSTPDLRRKPVFMFNVIVIMLGIAIGIFHIYGQYLTMLSEPVSKAYNVAAAFLFELAPTMADFVLLLRVYAVYPPHRLSPVTRSAIYGPLVLMKVARLVNMIMYGVNMGTTTEPVAAEFRAWATPEAKIAWFLQTFDNTFTSILFLSRLIQGQKNNSQLTIASSSRSADSYLSRLRTLFWIATSNFVFPVILNIIQLICAFRDANFNDGINIYLINVYVQIIGAPLATIWSIGTQTTPDKVQITHSITIPRFAHTSGLYNSTNGGSDIESTASRIAPHDVHDESRDDK
ncbi:hypothetical protein DICSQDRAFT_147987 [Dichomitus squalens LYAD-421 SS1]|uniref:Fungal pheromone mating factor STE2 GPCR-domain-containing protein n=2 Tax=Dichomitus squalens TaxID=114155 RepID=A0A4Q9MDG4_9APHY|nr:uncharacterized protein DICSQDRAFT_147987 [Dichomitus squalens LYAD-421 SS1]EJF60337.1 hypothetical protein DICSQDRAFT_147987 [Dichomitus squalens LYAD-421 SS1]TBU23761.1 hypothetical protein BD311DRAFT_730722 [Dichomitus squalens]